MVEGFKKSKIQLYAVYKRVALYLRTKDGKFSDIRNFMYEKNLLLIQLNKVRLRAFALRLRGKEERPPSLPLFNTVDRQQKEIKSTLCWKRREVISAYNVWCHDRKPHITS